MGTFAAGVEGKYSRGNRQTIDSDGNFSAGFAVGNVSSKSEVDRFGEFRIEMGILSQTAANVWIPLVPNLSPIPSPMSKKILKKPSNKNTKKGKSNKSKKNQPINAPIEMVPLTLKEQQLEKRKANKAKQDLSQFMTMVGVVSTVIGAIGAVLGGVKGGVGGFAGTLIILSSFKYPEKALYGFLIYLPLGGSITYAIGGGDNPVLQLAKDAFYVPAVIALYQTGKINGKLLARSEERRVGKEC